MSAQLRALCNTCMRVRIFPSFKAMETEPCQCGGTWDGGDGYCNCAGCQSTINDLERGGRCAEAVPNFMPGAKITSWTAEGGAA